MNGGSARRDAVVVGAGPNGLAAAVRMAQAGLSVLVLEAEDTIGGGLRSRELTLPGFLHDVCSAVHPLARASPFFGALPLEDHGLSWCEPPLPLAHPLGGDRAALLHSSVSATAESLGTDAGSWSRLMGPLVERRDALFREILGPLIHLPRAPLSLAAFALPALRSAAGLARSRFATPQARALFAGLSAHSFLPLEQAPSAAFGLVLAIAGQGVGWPFPRGGARRIAEALASLLRSLGGEIVAGRRVASLEDLPPSRSVFLDVGPRALLDVAGARLPAGYRRRLRNYRYGPGVFKIDYALREPIPWSAKICSRAGTVHLGGTLEEIADGERAVAVGEIPERPFVLLAQPSLFDPTRAPEGRHTAWAYCHVPSGSTVDMTSRIEDQIERFAPGFRDVVLARHAADCAWFERENPNLVGGDINGGLADLRQMLFRPVLRAPYRTPVPGVYLCSASTPPGGGVHGMCGFHAAEQALRDRFR